ncbi:MAG: PilZ domain-containing protein [Sulfuricaulis sp.]
MERRADDRQAVTISIEILDPPHPGKVSLITRDLSKGGAFILVSKEYCLPVGRIVSLRMPGVLWGEKISTISARVVRVTDAGMALQFLDFDFM